MFPNGSSPPAALVLAAGKGSRMNSRYPKPVHPLLGKPMGRYAIDLCHRLGIERVIVVVGHGAERVREALGDDVEYVEQAERRGTGHAVSAARSLLADYAGTLLVLPADCPLLTDEVVSEMLRRHEESEAVASLLPTALSSNPAGDIFARAAASVYLFHSPTLFGALGDVQPDPATGETDLTAVAALLEGRGERVVTEGLHDPAGTLDVNDRVRLAHVTAVLRRRILHAHMHNGVTVEDPDTTYIDPDVVIGQDTVIRPMTWLCGKTIVGEESDIGPSVRITDCTLGDRVSVQSAVLAQSMVGDDTRIGPFAQLRPGCRIGRKVKIGNFVELKNAEVEDRASMGHLAYIGDAFVGEKSNIGAGTITCNYDGKNKHRTRIGQHTFIGSHSTLIAPVEVGDGGFVAAGTVVTGDVPPDALAIGRSRQSNKPDWARLNRERRERE